MKASEISQWIDNDEGLYNWWKGSKQKKKQFIQENHKELIRVIKNVTEGKKRPHYLTYG